MESFDLLPTSISKPEAFQAMSDEQQSKLNKAEETFQQSSTLKVCAT